MVRIGGSAGAHPRLQLKVLPASPRRARHLDYAQLGAGPTRLARDEAGDFYVQLVRSAVGLGRLAAKPPGRGRAVHREWRRLVGA